jgi:hypothetical protein
MLVRPPSSRTSSKLPDLQYGTPHACTLVMEPLHWGRGCVCGVLLICRNMKNETATPRIMPPTIPMISATA